MKKMKEFLENHPTIITALITAAMGFSVGGIITMLSRLLFGV